MREQGGSGRQEEGGEISTRVSFFPFFLLVCGMKKTMAFLRHSADKAALKKKN